MTAKNAVNTVSVKGTMVSPFGWLKQVAEKKVVWVVQEHLKSNDSQRNRSVRAPCSFLSSTRDKRVNRWTVLFQTIFFLFIDLSMLLFWWKAQPGAISCRFVAMMIWTSWPVLIIIMLQSAWLHANGGNQGLWLENFLFLFSFFSFVTFRFFLVPYDRDPVFVTETTASHCCC